MGDGNHTFGVFGIYCVRNELTLLQSLHQAQELLKDRE